MHVDTPLCRVISTAVTVLLSAGVVRVASAIPSLEAVIESMRERERQLVRNHESFSISFEITSVDEHHESGGQKPAAYRNARKGGRWYASEQLLAPMDDIGTDRRIHISDSIKSVDCHYSNTIAFVQAASNTSNVCGAWHYTQALGINIYELVAETHGISLEELTNAAGNEWVFSRPYLPGAIEKNTGAYDLAPDPVQVRGIRCWKLEREGVDEIYMEDTEGLPIVKRVYWVGEGKPLQCEVNFYEYSDRWGVLLPSIAVVTNYGKYPDGPKELWGVKRNTITYKLTDVAFNSVEDSAFELKLDPGFRVYDQIRDLSYVVMQPGADPFSDVLPEAQELLREESSSRSRLLLVGNIMLIGALGALLLWRYVTRWG
ncbi:MAG: hypothetical protein AAF662_04485 [Pseudomonadota bacterium]